jgi:hypothetical protein
VTLFGIAAFIIITIIFFLFLISIISTVLDFDAPHFQVVFFQQRTHAPEQATLCWWGVLWMFFVVLHE